MDNQKRDMSLIDWFSIFNIKNFEINNYFKKYIIS